MPRVRRPAPGAAARYLRKAEEFLRAASSALSVEDWNAAGMAAIHAGISSVDAYLAGVYGLRSASREHAESARLLRELGGGPVAERASALERLLARKTLVEYEDRLVTPREAREAFARAERMVAWARAGRTK